MPKKNLSGKKDELCMKRKFDSNEAEHSGEDKKLSKRAKGISRLKLGDVEREKASSRGDDSVNITTEKKETESVMGIETSELNSMSEGKEQLSHVKIESILNSHEEQETNENFPKHSEFVLPIGFIESEKNGLSRAIIRKLNTISQITTNNDLFSISELEELIADLEMLVSEIINYDNSAENMSKYGKETGTQIELKRNNSSKGSDFVGEGQSIKRMHERLYLEIFCGEFSNIILSISRYDSEAESYNNPLRDIVLDFSSREPLVYAAILAQGAKLSFERHGMKSDQEAYHYYLEKCVTLSKDLCCSVKSKTDSRQSKSVVEVLILTILLLSTLNVYNIAKRRTKFLRGVHDTFIKVSQSSMKDKSYSFIILCKFWFLSSEILYALSIFSERTISTDKDLEILLSFDDGKELQILKDLGILLDSGFNLLGGYHIDCMQDFRELIKLLNQTREDRHDKIKPETFKYIDVLSKFSKHKQIAFNDTRCLISTDDISEEEGSKNLFYEKISFDNQSYYINWLDLSHQSYMYAAIITILTGLFGLGSDDPNIINLLDGLFTLFPLSNPSSNFSRPWPWPMLMFQWPLLVGGMNCIKENDKLAVMKYFRLVAEMGSPYAPTCHQILDRIWLVREKGVNDLKTQLKSLSDIIPY